MIFPKQIDTSITGRLEDIQKAFEAEAYLSAISLALTIPDVCGKRLYPHSSVRDRYTRWFNEYAAPHYLSDKSLAIEGEMTASKFNFSGDDCYSLRCAYLHEGVNSTESDKKTNYNAIQFRVFADGPSSCDCVSDVAEGLNEEGFKRIDLDLNGFISCIAAGVMNFLSEHPEANADNGSDSFLYAPVLDFKNGREFS